MKRTYRSLFAVALMASVALILSSLVGSSGAMAADPNYTFGATDFYPQQFERDAQNRKGETFWFPALYGKTESKLTVDSLQIKDATTGEISEPTSYYSYKVEITLSASKDGTRPGEAKLVAMEGVKNILAKGMLEIPEFVWAIAPLTGTDTVYLPYRVTQLANDLFSFAIASGDGSTNNPYKYRAVYFTGAGSRTGTTTDDIISDISAHKVGALSVTTSVPAVVNKNGKPDSLRAYGLAKIGAEVRVLPTRFVKTPEYTNVDLSKKGEEYGSAFFQGWVHGAKTIADPQLRFGYTNGDKRDKSFDPQDWKNLGNIVAGIKEPALVFSGANNAAAAFSGSSITGTAIQFDYAILNNDAGPFTVEIAPGAFSADTSIHYSSITFGPGLTGDLGEAGFGELGGKFDRLYFDDISSPDDEKMDGKPLPAGLTFGGDNLFAGKEIDDLYLPKYLTTIGKGWFKNAKINQSVRGSFGVQSVSHYLSKLTSIEESAFEGATLPSEALAVFGKGSGFGTDNGGFDDDIPFKGSAGSVANPPVLADTAIVNIGDKAFYGATFTDIPAFVDLSPFKFVTSIGDSAFAFAKGKKLDGFRHFNYLVSLGKGAFYGDTLIVDTVKTPVTTIVGILDGEKPTASDVVIALPDRFLTTLPTQPFENVTLLRNRNNAQYETVKSGKFYFSDKATPATTIDADAFYGNTVYVHFAHYEAWKNTLKTATVIAYGIYKPENGLHVRVFDGVGKTFNLKDSTHYQFPYGLSGETLRLDFTTAFAAGANEYAITGPQAAEGSGFLTEKGGYVELGNDVKKTGIAIPSNLPAGLYIVFTKKDIDSAKPDTTPIYVTPVDLTGLVIDTLHYTWVGNKFPDLLKSITLSSLIVHDKEAIDNPVVTFSDLDVRLIHESLTTLPVDTVKTKVQKVATLRGAGNYNGALDVFMSYLPMNLSDLTADDIVMGDVDFTGTEKNYPFTGKLTVKNHGLNVDLNYKEGGEVTLDYVSPETVTSSAIPVTITANVKEGVISKVTGSTDKASYNVVASWSVLAGYDFKERIKKSVTFDGTSYVLSPDIIDLLYLTAGDYDLVAIKGYTRTLKSINELETVGGGIVKGLLPPGIKYDLYIIPAGTYVAQYAKKDNAHYAGSIEYGKLSLDAFKAAFTPVIEGTDEEGNNLYGLSVDESVYAGGYTYKLDAKKTVFTVKMDKDVIALNGIDAGEEDFDGSFTLDVPTGLPTTLRFVFVDESGKEVTFPKKTIRIGDEPYDLSVHLRADKDAKIDFLKEVEWTLSGDKGKLTLDEYGFITALEEWQGAKVTATVAETGAKAEITIDVLNEGDDLPESVASVAAGKRSVSYADGKLTLKGFGGTTATLYRLNGTAAAQVKVVGDDAAYGVALTKGFYLVKAAGTTVTKIVVR